MNDHRPFPENFGPFHHSIMEQYIEMKIFFECNQKPSTEKMISKEI